MKPLVVIPTYNEAQNIGLLLKEIFQESSSPQIAVLVVDDNSPDGTALCVKQLQEEAPFGERVFLLERTQKRGLGRAYVAGFQWGLKQDYNLFIEMDADFSHPPRFLPVMVHALEQVDVAIGSRYVPGGGVRNWNFFRKCLSRGGSLYSRWLLGHPVRDFTGGFNGWRREVLEKVDLNSLASEGYAFQIELKFRALEKGFHFIEFPIIFEERKEGISKMNRGIIFEALRSVWHLRAQKKRR